MAESGVPPDHENAPVVTVFEPDAAAASAARSVVRRTLLESDHPELIDTACLLTSELVTNAVRHAHTPVELIVDVRGNRLRVEVVDGADDAPSVATVAEAPTGATRGRGLHLVDRLADRWGVTRSHPGKSVWFALQST